MQDSITIAEVGSMLKVSGSRIATPFGPPRPGSTPTKMPSTRPSIIRAILSQVISTWKPWNNSSNASIAALSELAHDLVRKVRQPRIWSGAGFFRGHALEAEGRLERTFRHD